jgi:DNA-binding CsgD family transcriptional regulator
MSNDDLQKLATLSKREREVLWLVCEGNSYKEISGKLFISIPTVKATMGRVYLKLGLDLMS